MYQQLKQFCYIFDRVKPYFKEIPKRPYFGHDSTLYGIEVDLNHIKPIPDITELIKNTIDPNLVCTNHWISMSPTNTKVVRHNHIDLKNSPIVSAILYVQATKETGLLRLEDYDIELLVETGDLVIFPANCYHSVEINQSMTTRISIALDFSLSKIY